MECYANQQAQLQLIHAIQTRQHQLHWNDQDLIIHANIKPKTLQAIYHGQNCSWFLIQHLAQVMGSSINLSFEN